MLKADLGAPPHTYLLPTPLPGELLARVAFIHYDDKGKPYIYMCGACLRPEEYLADLVETQGIDTQTVEIPEVDYDEIC